jgi:hypothetical protein
MSAIGVFLIILILALLIGLLIYYLYPRNTSDNTGPTGLYPVFTTFRNTTAETDIGNYAYYLNRQTIDCGPKAVLNEFVLSQGSGVTGIYYNYTCMGATDIGVSQPQTTNIFPIGDNQLNSLTPFNIVCDQGYGIGKMHLNTLTDSDGGQTRNEYEYDCLPVPGLSNPQTFTTNSVPNTFIPLEALIGQDVMCGTGGVLNQVQLINSGNNSTQYTYTCYYR